MPRTSLYDRKNENGLFVIQKNKDLEPKDKQLILAETPHVKVMPYGIYAGAPVASIRLSFSPLLSFPKDFPDSKSDLDSNGNRKGVKTVEELTDWAKKRQTNLVFIQGGEAFYKYCI